MEQKIQDQGKSLSEDAMEKLQKDYQAKALDLKRFQDDAQRELEESQRKELGELEKRIMPVINEVAQGAGLRPRLQQVQLGAALRRRQVRRPDGGRHHEVQLADRGSRQARRGPRREERRTCCGQTGHDGPPAPPKK